MVNTALIKQKMSELQITQKGLATYLGLKAPTVSQKINNLRPISLDEAEIIASVLGITTEDFTSYFLWQPVA